MKYFDFNLDDTIKQLVGKEFKTFIADSLVVGLIKQITDQNEANVLLMSQKTFFIIRKWGRGIYETNDKMPFAILSNKYKTEIYVSNKIDDDKIYFLKTKNIYDYLFDSDIDSVVMNSIIMVKTPNGESFARAY